MFAVVFVDVDLADVGASHFRLDAVQVQGAVLSTTHCHRVDGHLLVGRQSRDGSGSSFVTHDP